MKRQAPRLDPPLLDSKQSSSNLPLLVIAVAFLCVTIVLVLLQPSAGPGRDQIAEAPQPYDIPLGQNVPVQQTEQSTPVPVAIALQPQQSQPTQVQQPPAPTVTVTQPTTVQPPVATQTQPVAIAQVPAQPITVAPSASQQQRPVATQVETETEAVVTRTEIPLLTVAPALPQRSESVANVVGRQLRQPLRLTSTNRPPTNLPALTEGVLQQLGAPAFAPIDPVLKEIIVESMLQLQSDTFVAVNLNTALARGTITVPPGVRTASGNMDVDAVLNAMIEGSGGELPAPRVPLRQTGKYIVQGGDSLAGIASRYYGRPLDFVHILEANPSLRNGGGLLQAGQRITLPAL